MLARMAWRRARSVPGLNRARVMIMTHLPTVPVVPALSHLVSYFFWTPSGLVPGSLFLPYSSGNCNITPGPNS